MKEEVYVPEPSPTQEHIGIAQPHTQLIGDPISDLPREFTGWAVVGPFGNIWAENVFETPEEAQQYVFDFWCKDLRSVPAAKSRMAGFRAVPVKVVATPFNLDCAQPLDITHDH